MANVKAIMARIEAERAAGKERQISVRTKTVVRPMRDRTAPKPPQKVTVGRRAAAKSKPVAKTTAAELAEEKETTDDGSK